MGRLAIAPLSNGTRRRTSAPMPPRPDLFDRRLRALRRDRAAAIGGDGFLHERAFDECLDRLAAIARRFERALLVGCFGADWPARLGAFADVVEVVDDAVEVAAADQGPGRHGASGLLDHGGHPRRAHAGQGDEGDQRGALVVGGEAVSSAAAGVLQAVGDAEALSAATANLDAAVSRLWQLANGEVDSA